LALNSETKDDIDFTTALPQLFFNMPAGDMWGEAHLKAVALYLRGAKDLEIPAGWRAFLPDAEFGFPESVYTAP
jgi:hypothetical protein